MTGLPGISSGYYLTGIDWFVHLFDHLARRATGVGNLFQVVVTLEGSLPETELRKTLFRLHAHFPLLSGRTRRALNLAPRYRPCASSRPPADILTIHRAAGPEEVPSLLEDLANRPFSPESEHLDWHLIRAGDTSHLVMRCDHRLFDARGAEAFLYQLEQAHQGISLPDIQPDMPSHLNHWRKKFLAGQSTNRMFLKLAKNGTPRALPVAADSRRYKFVTIPFTRDQSEQILESAYARAGFLMLMPYLLAVTIILLHPIFAARGCNPGGYVIPVTIDRRDPDAVQQEMFFNHLSFLFFHLHPRETAEDIDATLTTIKNQLYDQVKTGFSEAIYESGFLMRILPPPLLSRMMNIYLKGQLASFSFSHLGEAAYPAKTLLGMPITNIVHTPRLPVPPGIGAFFTQFQGRLNLTLSFLEGMLSNTEADALQQQFQKTLTAS